MFQGYLSRQTLIKRYSKLELANKLDHGGNIRDLDVVRQTVSEVQPEVVFHLAAATGSLII